MLKIQFWRLLIFVTITTISSNSHRKEIQIYHDPPSEKSIVNIESKILIVDESLEERQITENPLPINTAVEVTFLKNIFDTYLRFLLSLIIRNQSK